MNVKQIFGRRLRVAMSAKGLKQYEVSEAMGVGHASASNWMRGHAMPEASALPELAQLLGVSIDWLCGRTDKNGPKI